MMLLAMYLSTSMLDNFADYLATLNVTAYLFRQGTFPIVILACLRRNIDVDGSTLGSQDLSVKTF